MAKRQANLSYIPLDKLDAHPLNSNEMNEAVFEKVKANIKRSGQYPALIVREEKGTDRFQILDGWHRKQILVELNYTEAKCEIWEADDIQANLLLATLNRLKGTDDVKKRGKLLDELYEDFNHDKTLLGLIPESERGLESLLKTVKKDSPIFDEETERGLVEEKLMQSGVDTETAKQIADGYRPPIGSNVWILKFVFKDIFQYNKAAQFFGKNGNIVKLLEIVDNYGKEQKT